MEDDPVNGRKVIPRLVAVITFIVLAFFGGTTSRAQDGKVFVKEAERLRAKGQLEEALDQYRLALRVNPEYVAALTGRASLYHQMARLDDRMNDLEQVAALTPKDAKNQTLAAEACLDAQDAQKARQYADRALELSRKNMQALQVKSRACLMMGDVACALATADDALALKATTDTYYLHALSRMASGDHTTAEADLDKVIEWNPLYEAAYVASAEVQLALYKGLRGPAMQVRTLEKAILRATQGLDLNPVSTELLIVRSKAHALQKEYSKAIDDVSKCVALGREDSVVYYQRAQYYHGFGQEQNAVNDLNRLLLRYPDHVTYLLLRAECAEANLDLEAAARDLSWAEKQIKAAPERWSTTDLRTITQSKERVQLLAFELNRETDPPVITVIEPLRKDDVVQVSSALSSVKVLGHVRDKSRLKKVTVQGIAADYDPDELSPEFRATIPLLANAEEIRVEAQDVYGNESGVVLKVQRTEGDPPTVSVSSPRVADGLVTLTTGDHQLFVEGRATDPSGIRSVMVDGKYASFIPDTNSTEFSIRLDVAGKDRFTVRAADQYGNVAELEYGIKWVAPVAPSAPPAVAERKDSPMGVSWVIYIENSHYQHMPALTSLNQAKMQKAFGKYDAQRTIVKKNMTKGQIERFFNLELRDMVRAAKVNTILVWYEGHGRSQSGKAYWIPVDAKADDIYSFYNYGPLKGLMENYSESVKTTLVVSDAAGTDPSFYELTR